MINTQAAAISNVAPLVSVLMITYNHEAWIARAIESVLSQQTDLSFELVIGEDCSTDRTRDIVADYQRRFPDIIRVIVAERNVGAHENNRRTLAAARGKYVAFCEGDDEWHGRNKLRLQVAYLEAQPACVLVHSNFDFFYERSGRRCRDAMPIRADWDDASAYEDILTGYRRVMTVTVVARRDALVRVTASNSECYDPKYLLGDLQLWLELSKVGEVHCVPQSLATHNMLTDSASHSSNPEMELRFSLSMHELVNHYTQKYPCSPACVQKARLWSSLFALNKAWRAGRRDLCEKFYFEYSGLRGGFSPHAWLLRFGSAPGFARAASRPLSAAYLAARELVTSGLRTLRRQQPG